MAQKRSRAGSPRRAFANVSRERGQNPASAVAAALAARQLASSSVLQVELLLNRVGPASGHLSVKDISSTLGMEVFAIVPDDWATASGAINLGEPLMTNSPKSKLRLAIQEIAHRLHSPEGQADVKEAPKQGLIGRIFAGG